MQLSDLTNYINVRDCGAAGDGAADDAGAIQRALDAGKLEVYVPAGKYMLGTPLRIGSNTTLLLDEKAEIKLMDSVCKTRHDCIISNKDPVGGNCNIAISGGLWDGNNPGNHRTGGLFDEGFTGSAFRLLNVKGLIIENMTINDPEAYYLMLGEVERFYVRDITFRADNPRGNQDGVHLGGFCSDGVITNITAYGTSTNDDMIAMNADDNCERLTNHGMKRGPIKNITVRNVRAENCFTFIRMLSVDAEISNIYIDGVYGGCRNYGINMDGARYCRTPLFEDKPGANVGNIHDVTVRNMHVFKSIESKAPIFDCESGCKNFRVENFKRVWEKDMSPDTPTVIFRKTAQTDMCLSGIEADTDIQILHGAFSAFELN